LNSLGSSFSKISDSSVSSSLIGGIGHNAKLVLVEMIFGIPKVENVDKTRIIGIITMICGS
jgi:hypothetical protein